MVIGVLFLVVLVRVVLIVGSDNILFIVVVGGKLYECSEVCDVRGSCWVLVIVVL